MTLTRTRRRLALPIAFLAAGAMLVGCSAKPSPAHIAYIIGTGSGDANTVKEIVNPGESMPGLGDDRVYFIPAGPRNHIVAPPSQDGCRVDSCEAHTGTTQADDEGRRLPVASYSRAFMTINRNHDVLREFYPLCAKYGCGTDDQGEVESDSNYAPEGWVSMLAQTFKFAHAEAFRTAIATFPSNVWEDESQWPAVAEKMSEAFPAAMQKATGLDVDIFCGQSITEGAGDEQRTKASCTPVTFAIDSIKPPKAIEDSRDALSQQQADLRIAEGEEALILQRRKNATDLYGGEADRVLGTLDTIEACKAAGQACTVIVGGGSSVTVQAPPAG